MGKRIIVLVFVFLINQSLSAQTSPWGTGIINNQLIGNLQDTTVIFASQSGFGNYGLYPNPSALLPNYTFDIYIPTTYDGSEEYGLITFINSGDNGGIISSWIPVLEEKKLILISGDNIGNSVNVDIRMGLTMAAVYRLREVLNIDDTRIYSSGNSGGARAASVLAWTYPEWFYGALPNCGCAYLREVDQDYETQQPNSNYEYVMPFDSSYLSYVKTFNRNYAILTSYDDFREGDIMNIYHNGLEEDGFRGKFLEIPGPHCVTSTEHFLDAVNFVEHPHISIVKDEFTPTPEVGSGFKMVSSSVIGQQLVLDHSSSTIARAYSNDPFSWNDEKGAIIRTTISLDSLAYNQNTFFNIGLLDFSDVSVYNEDVGDQIYQGKPNFIVNINFDGVDPTVHILAESPSSTVSNDTLFSGVFEDWNPSTKLDVKLHLWNQEIRVEFSNHFNLIIQSNGSLTKLLDDNRSIQIRTENNFWEATDFTNGTLLTLVSGKLDEWDSSVPLNVHKVEVISASNDINPINDGTNSLTASSATNVFKVFPNPTANGFFNIISDSDQQIQFDIYSSDGRLVQTHDHVGTSSILNLKTTESGIYFMKADSVETPIKLIVR